MSSDLFDTDVLIIGGGISGLANAWWLNQSGVKVKLWEKQSRLGGKIQTHRSNGFQTEQAASMVMNFRPEVDELIQQSGLEAYKVARKGSAQESNSPSTAKNAHSQSKRYLLHQGKLQAVPMTMGKLFCSPMWSLKGKLRLLLEPLISRGDNPQETVSEFITRRLGREFLDTAMEPFVAGTLASDPDRALARYVLPRLTTLERKYGSLTAGMVVHKILGKRTARITENFSFQGGMSTLCEQLAKGIQSKQGQDAITTQIDVQRIIPQGKNHWRVEAQTAQGVEVCTCRHLILSTPAHHTAQLSRNTLPQLANALEQIVYAPISVVHLGLATEDIQHPLDSAGFLVPRLAGLGINGNLWMSSLFPQRAPKEYQLLSTYLGGSRDPQAIHLTEAESIDRVLENLSPILKLSGMVEPCYTRVNKHYRGLPLYQGNYHEIRQILQQQLRQHPSLHIQANYLDGVSVRDRLSTARQQSAMIVSSLQQESSRLVSLSSHPGSARTAPNYSGAYEAYPLNR